MAMNNKKIQHWDDERSIGNGIIITLKHGWSFEYKNHECIRGFSTLSDAKKAVMQVYKCECSECISNMNK